MSLAIVVRNTVLAVVLTLSLAVAYPLLRPLPSLAAVAPPLVHGETIAPMIFTANAGQWPDSVLFRADAAGAVLWISSSGIRYQVFEDVSLPSGGPHAHPLTHTGAVSDHEPSPQRFETIDARFAGAQPLVRVYGEGDLVGRHNYFLGDDPTRWRTGVPSYSSIVFKDLYPGIDLRISAGAGTSLYEYSGESGSKSGVVRVAYEGAAFTFVQAEGRVVALTSKGSQVEVVRPPVRLLDRVSTPLFVAEPQQALGTSNQSASTPPELVYSTYLGGSGSDAAYDVSVDGSGHAYVVGYTASANFPTAGPYQTDQAGLDVFITKMSIGGNSLVYSTYLGGAGDDYGSAIAVDSSGAAYVVGTTYSTAFPTVNPFQTNQTNEDGFVTKLSSAGDSLVFSTYLGGNASDGAAGLDVDDSGNVYVTGATTSNNFPIVNAYQADQPVQDAFVTKLASTGSSALYSTYLGGSGIEWGTAIAVDGNGSAYISGITESTNFPIASPYQANRPGTDAFVTKLSPAGNSLSYSTYLGNSGSDRANAIAVDPDGYAYVIGSTDSPDFPLHNPIYTEYFSVYTGFATKLSQGGNLLVYSTYLNAGIYNSSYAYDLALDAGRNTYVVGSNSGDVFVFKLAVAGNLVHYYKDIPGDRLSEGYGIAVDDSGYAYLTGWTDSTGFPMINAYQSYQGGVDAFVLRIAPYDDQDGDGLVDSLDNCPLIANAGQSNADGDASGDVCDNCTDTDDDGYGNPGFAASTCPVDNCPYLPNPGQADSDGDSVGDDCDFCPGSDDLQNADGDGFPDACDVCTDTDHDGYGNPGFPANTCVTDNCPTVTNASQTDSDGDGFGNSCDVCPGGNDLVDADSDGVADHCDNCPLLANPGQADSDHDGVGDVCECIIDFTGDANGSGTLTSADIIGLVNYVFKSGPDPLPCKAVGDVNCSGAVTSADIISMVNHVFKGGPAPCDVCTLIPGTWSCP